MMLWLRKMLKTPKTQLGFLLFLILLSVFLRAPSLKIVQLFFISIFSCILFDFIFLKIRRIPLFFPSAALVTGTIITLLTAPNLPWYEPLIISFFAMFSKNFLRFSQRHMFNPAAFGVLLGAFLFGTNVSWWAVSWEDLTFSNIFSLIPFLLLILPIYISLRRMRKYFIVIPFLFVYSILRAALAHGFSISFLNDPTLLFFSAVMLPEPMTTPSLPKKQVLFGIFVAVLSVIFSLPHDPLIFSLLLGNALFFFLR